MPNASKIFTSSVIVCVKIDTSDVSHLLTIIVFITITIIIIIIIRSKWPAKRRPSTRVRWIVGSSCTEKAAFGVFTEGPWLHCSEVSPSCDSHMMSHVTGVFISFRCPCLWHIFRLLRGFITLFDATRKEVRLIGE